MRRKMAALVLTCLARTTWAQPPEPPPAGLLHTPQGTVEVQDGVVEGPASTTQSESPLRSPNPNQSSNLNPFPSHFLPWSLAAPGQSLGEGATIRSAGQSGAVISLPDGVELRLDENTTVTLSRGPNPVRLLRGRVWIHTSRPLNLNTNQGQVKLTGTEVVLSAGPNQSVLTVLEGQAQVGASQVVSGTSVEILPGEIASAPVQVDVANQQAWVQSSTLSDKLPVRPFFLTSQAREAARSQALSRLASQPDQPESLQTMSQIYLDEMRLEEAQKSIQRLGGRAPATLKGRLALLTGKPQEAAAILQDPVDRGLALWAAGQRSQSARALTEAVKQSPDDPYAQAALGYLIDFQQGRYALAAQRLESALSQQPQDPVLHRQLGDVYVALRRSGAAVDQFEQAMQLGLQQDADTSLRMGSLLTRLGRFQEATHYFDAYREQAPSVQADVHQALAQGYLAIQQGEYALAHEWASKALDLSQSQSPALTYLALDLQGLALASQRLYPQAVDCYHRALLMTPGDAYLLNDLGVSLRKSGRLSEALESLRKSSQEAPYSPAVRGNLARLYFVLQQPQRAQSEFERGLQFSPQDPFLQIGLSDALSFQGLDDSSSRLLRQSTMLDPLLLAPKPSLAVALATTSPNGGPIYGAGYLGKQGPLAYRLLFNSQLHPPLAPLGPQNDANTQVYRGELGWVITPSDRVVLGLQALRGTSTEGSTLTSGYQSQGDTEVGYVREFGAHSRLWALYSQRQQFLRRQALAPLPFNPRDGEVRIRNNSWEARFDQQLGAWDTLSLGYAHNQATADSQIVGFLPTGNSSQETRRTLSELWLSNSLQINDETRLFAGCSWNKIQTQSRQTVFTASGRVADNALSGQDSDVLNPFLGLVSELTPQTRLSLSVVRQSNLNTAREDGFNVGPVSRLMPVNISSTTLFPLSFGDRLALQVNSLDGQTLLPVTDYRMRLQHEFHGQVFGTAELFRSDLSSAFRDDAFLNSPLLANLAAGERHRLQGLTLNTEFWDGGDLTGNIRYRYSDFRFQSGPNAGQRWVGVPEHQIQANLFHAVHDQLVLQWSPSYQSSVPLDPTGQNSQGGYFQLDALLHWTPWPDSRISLGYQNVFQESRSFQQPGVISNVLIAF